MKLYMMLLLNLQSVIKSHAHTDHITPTSNIVERLFSRCGIIMRPHRRLMDPSTLEMLIMLRFNKDLWDAHEVDMMGMSEALMLSKPRYLSIVDIRICS